MIKKFAKLVVRQPPFLLRGLIIFILCVIIVSQLVILRSQSPEHTKVQQEAALVKMIPEMELKIKNANMPAPMPAVVESMSLQGTFVQGGTFTALINGRIVKEGDALGNYKVIKITRNSAVLEDPITHEIKDLQMPSK